MLAGTLALAGTAADAQTSNDGGNGGMGNMPGMSGMATAQSTSSRGSIFDLVRAAIATAPFHSLDGAPKVGGYVAEVADMQHITCIADPTVPSAGTMGVHLLEPAGVTSTSTTTRTSPTQSTRASPSCSCTSPMAQATSSLVALEYLILQKRVGRRRTPARRPCSARTFMSTDANNRFGLPAYYSLHAWIWKFNPSGTFAMWNPNVHCPT